MRPFSDIAGPIPGDSLGLRQWLVRFWDHHADLATDPDQRAYCEDEAWHCTTMIEAAARDASRALAQQEVA